MKIGDRVKVIATDEVWGEFYGVTGTIVDEFTTVINVHKFIVEFDYPFYSEWLDDDCIDNSLSGYDFPDRCLELETQ